VHEQILEPTQVCEATEKGLKAIAVNEDTIRAETAIWKRVRNEHHNLIYISAELAVGVGSPMLLLWKDLAFGKLLGAIFIDKVHCIDEWGAKFHEEYPKLKQLHSFTSFEVPIIACSVTMPTSTFDIIWDILDYGHRPFWGLDVGTIRENLFYTIRPITSTKEQLHHILNILPASLTADTLANSIPKTLVYFATPKLCVQFVQEL
jgi:superfamily II DNA helicase RecQ